RGLVTRKVPHRAHFDTSRLDPGKLGGDPDRLVHTLGLDDVEAGEQLLGLREGTVHDGPPAAADANRLGGRRGLEHLRIHQRALLAQLGGMLEAITHLRVVLPGRELVHQLGISIDQDRVFHGFNLEYSIDDRHSSPYVGPPRSPGERFVFTRLSRVLLALSFLVTPLLSAQSPTPDKRVGLRAGWWDAAQAAWNMRLVSTTAPTKDFIPAEAGNFDYMNSDIAFRG